jgi:Sulfotransferase domain
MGHDSDLHVRGTVTLTAELLQGTVKQPPVPCDKKHILVTAFPKSGSTWLSEIFAQLPDFYRVHLVPAYGHREDELSFERLIIFHAFNYAAQLHCRRSYATEQYMKIFSIKPIILIRNIFDCVVSMKDHIDRVKLVDDDDPDKENAEMAFAHVGEDYFSLAEDEKIDFVIDLVVPWYFNFFVGWQGYPDAEWVTYEALRAAPLDVVKRISERFDLGLDQPTIEAALAAATAPVNRIRKNVGKAGRGTALLSEVQKDRIRNLTRYYPATDFAAIGL